MAVLAQILSLVTLVCGIFILINAFKQSVGIGFCCLCIPFVIIWFAFARFKHEKKTLIVAGFLGSWILSLILMMASGTFPGMS